MSQGSTPGLCLGCQKFNGSPAFNNLCSVCFKISQSNQPKTTATNDTLKGPPSITKEALSANLNTEKAQPIGTLTQSPLETDQKQSHKVVKNTQSQGNTQQIEQNDPQKQDKIGSTVEQKQPVQSPSFFSSLFTNFQNSKKAAPPVEEIQIIPKQPLPLITQSLAQAPRSFQLPIDPQLRPKLSRDGQDTVTILSPTSIPVQPATTKSRCNICAKRINIASSYECGHCKLEFCRSHRLPEEHQCETDFIIQGRKKLKEDTTTAEFKKINQI